MYVSNVFGCFVSFLCIIVNSDERALTYISLKLCYGSGPSRQHEFDGHLEDLLPAAA